MEEQTTLNNKDCSREQCKTNADFITKFRRSSRNRESHDEVAQLEAELRRAYVMKELQAQLEERQAGKHTEEMRKRESAELIQQRQRMILEEDLHRRSEYLRRSKEYRLQLDEQLTRKEREKQILMEESRRYRESLEEMDRLQEEQERTRILEKKCELVENARRERVILEEMREIGRREQREAEEKKRQRDLEYLREIEERSKELDKLRREQMEKRERVLLEVTATMLDTVAQRREKEELLIDLVAEEIRCELAIKEKEEIIRRKRMREELAASLEEQILFTEQCKLRFVEQDRVWANHIMRKIMEDEKVAKVTAETRRRMKAQYRDDLEALIEQRRRIRDEEIDRIEQAAKEEQKLKQIEAECAKEKRKRLLEEHAANIASFVNRATLTVEEQRFLAESTEVPDCCIKNVDNSVTMKVYKTA